MAKRSVTTPTINYQLMKSTLEIGIIQQSKTADIADNRRRLAEAVGQLAANGAKLIVNHNCMTHCISVRQNPWNASIWPSASIKKTKSATSIQIWQNDMG